jgi:hypothetical protein
MSTRHRAMHVFQLKIGSFVGCFFLYPNIIIYHFFQFIPQHNGQRCFVEKNKIKGNECGLWNNRNDDDDDKTGTVQKINSMKFIVLVFMINFFDCVSYRTLPECRVGYSGRHRQICWRYWVFVHLSFAETQPGTKSSNARDNRSLLEVQSDAN